MYNPMTADADSLHGYKIRLYPTKEQEERIKRFCDLYRFVYNKTVYLLMVNYLNISEEKYNAYLEKGSSIHEILLGLKDNPKGSFMPFTRMCRIMQDLRHELGWLEELPTNAVRYAISAVYQGYNKFFKGCNVHPPTYKSKKYSKKVFANRGERTRFINGYVKLEGFNDLIKCDDQRIPSYHKYYRVTVSYDGYGNYYLSMQTQIDYPIEFYPNEGPIGIDLGMRKLVTLSDGTIYKPLNTKRLEKRRRRKESRVYKDTQRRKVKAKQAKTKLEDIPLSKREQKRYIEYRKLSTHIWNKRRTYIHQITREIVNRRPSAIVIEDLKVMKMMKQFKRSGIDLREFNFSEFRRQIEYKARWNGIPVIVADHYYPSSQLCSKCGYRQKIGKSEVYKCPKCGLEIDRDINAALNLRSLAM